MEEALQWQEEVIKLSETP